MTDDAAEDPVAALRAVLMSLGCTEDEITRAQGDGTITLLALERIVLSDTTRYRIDEVSARTGLTEDEVVHLWRSLGFPAPANDEAVFNEVDVENLSSVAHLQALGVIEPELILQMSRVIGSSLARVAQAMVDAVTPGQGDDELETADLERLATSAGVLLPTMPRILDNVWRRHVQSVARRRLLRGTDGDHDVVVGFADMVGFTALSQQVSDRELATIVGMFESLVYDVITAEHGRVVKMIGDEVMFVVDSPSAAAEIALSLADASREADELTDVRVGMAYGSVLEREGDCFGPTVNLASRATSIAYPGSVVVSTELHDALAGDDGFTWRSMRPRYLKNIGRAHLYVMRRAEDGFESRFAERRRALGESVRARVEQGLDALRASDDEEE